MDRTPEQTTAQPTKVDQSNPGLASSGCVGVAGGGIVGFFLGIAVAYLDATESAGTEVFLYFIYAIRGIIIGGAAGLIGVWTQSKKSPRKAAIGWLSIVAIASLVFFGVKFILNPFW
jgi:hypothetical protein